MKEKEKLKTPEQLEKQRRIEEEKLSILSKTDATKGEQLTFTPEGEIAAIKELQDLALANIEDPEKKYDLFYKGIEKLLLQHLPKGKENAAARALIREEKSTFLSGGKRKDKSGRRGADSRMGYNADHAEFLKVIMEWVVNNGTMVQLYNTLRQTNIDRGYGTP